MLKVNNKSYAKNINLYFEHYSSFQSILFRHHFNRHQKEAGIVITTAACIKVRSRTTKPMTRAFTATPCKATSTKSNSKTTSPKARARRSSRTARTTKTFLSRRQVGLWTLCLPLRHLLRRVLQRQLSRQRCIYVCR